LGLEDKWARQLEAARAAWPMVEISVDEVVTVLEQRAAVSEMPDAIAVADIYIAVACAQGESNALRAFEARYFSGIGPALARISTDAAFIDEVKQIVREKMFVGSPPRIVELAGHGELGGLVRVVALRSALNVKRAQARIDLTDDDSLLDALVSSADPRLHTLKQQQKELVKRAFETAVGELEARDRNILRMYVLHSLGIDEIGRVHDVHRATAARWLERIREQLRKATIGTLRARLGLGNDEVESLIGAAESSLNISFQRLLAG
jgi:RNA polymerase sigma-70 factor (ECF subfamily)